MGGAVPVAAGVGRAVARRYGAGYLLLSAPREALTGVYVRTKEDARLRLVLSLPEGEWRLFEIENKMTR